MVRTRWHVLTGEIPLGQGRGTKMSSRKVSFEVRIKKNKDNKK